MEIIQGGLVIITVILWEDTIRTNKMHIDVEKNILKSLFKPIFRLILTDAKIIFQNQI